MATTGAYGPVEPWDLEIIREGTIQGIEASGTQAWKAGGLVIYSSGSIAEAGTSPAVVLGIAKKAATGTTGATVEYWPIKPGRLYAITVVGSGASGAFAQADIGTNMGLLKDGTTGYWYADNSDTNDQVTVRALLPDYAVGDFKVRALVTFDSANVQGF